MGFKPEKSAESPDRKINDPTQPSSLNTEKDPQKDESYDKKSSSELDGNTDKTNPPSSEKKIAQSSTSQKLKGALLALFGMVILIGIAYFLWIKLNRPEPLADFLPAKTTIALIEIDIDPNSSQVQQFFQLFQKHPVYQSSAIIQSLDTLIKPLEVEQMRPWLGRKIGIVFLQDPKTPGQILPALFLEKKTTESPDLENYLKHSRCV